MQCHRQQHVTSPDPLHVGVRYRVEFLGSGFTLRVLNDAVFVGTRTGPDGDEYEFETEMPVTPRVVTVRPDLILRAEPA